MGWFNNIRIRAKIISGFSLVLILMIGLLITAGVVLKLIDSNYSYVLDYPVNRLAAINKASTDIMDLRRITCAIGTNTGNEIGIANYENQLNAALKIVNEDLDSYVYYVDSDEQLDDAGRSTRKEKIVLISNLVNKYYNEVSVNVIKEAKANDLPAVVAVIDNSSDLMNELSGTAKDVVDIAKGLTDEYSVNNSATSMNIIILLAVIAFVVLIISILIAVFISSSISKPVNELVTIIDNVANGNLNVNIRHDRKDELGLLSKSSALLLDTFRKLIDNLVHMSKDHDNGEIDNYLKPSDYAGQYSEVALNVNKMVSGHIDIQRQAMATITEIVGGNFNADMKKLPGKKIFINQTIDELRVSIRNISNEVDQMINHSINGNLKFRIDSKKYKGDWEKLMNGLNEVLNAISQPVNEVQESMENLSRGNFTKTMSGNYKGDFLSIKEAVNSTINAMSSYITEVSVVLGKVAAGDLTQSISREYVGSFVEIKNSINQIARSLHSIMNDIANASQQVLLGSKQISNSSMDLATGATEQASSIQQLNESIELLSMQTQENAKNATVANDLSIKSTDNATKGNQEMQSMLTSMDGIKKSSDNISKIIKVIEDIAFQTNLLALNAAVEAARAGEHGKGFAVVAEEVRNLAARSQSAAKETTDLIDDSINRVNVGTKTASSTATSLNTIVENATEVSGLITNIATSSSNQSEAIGNISTGLIQISNVVQQNSSTSEETAAAAQELSSQAELLRQMVAFFKL